MSNSQYNQEGFTTARVTSDESAVMYNSLSPENFTRGIEVGDNTLWLADSRVFKVEAINRDTKRAIISGTGIAPHSTHLSKLRHANV